MRPMDSAAITVPVKYPYRARKTLLDAMEDAEIEVSGVYHEPVAALYCAIAAAGIPGHAAVFDWGGGTLDVAVVRLAEGFVQAVEVAGRKRGGDDFDVMIEEAAVKDFCQNHADLDLTPRDLSTGPRGVELKLLSEAAKIRLSHAPSATVSRAGFLGEMGLHFQLSRETFDDWITPDVDAAIGCLHNAARRASVSEQLLNPLLLSGGTSHIPLVRHRIQNLFHHVITSLPAHGDRHNREAQDAANATAIGAAMLAERNSAAVFACDVGIRVADAQTMSDTFVPVFKHMEPVEYGQAKRVPLFVTNASTGVARILICDRVDPDVEPAGRLKRIFTVPIDNNELWVDVEFQMDNHLVLQVSASGRIAHAEAPPCFLTDAPIGFEV